MKVRSALLALVATSLLLVAGCSSDSSDGGAASTTEAPKTTTAGDSSTETTSATEGGAPSEAELIVGLQDGLSATPERAACLAGELAGSDLSDASLQAIADANQDDVPADELDGLQEALQAALTACP